jgi:hypothetical protein
MLLNLWENGAGPISPRIAYKILQMIQNNSGEKRAKEHLPPRKQQTQSMRIAYLRGLI